MAEHAIPLKRPVDEDIVQLCSEMLERAKRGDISDVVIVAVIHDQEEPSFIKSAEFNDRWRILGALRYAEDAVLQSGRSEPV